MGWDHERGRERGSRSRSRSRQSWHKASQDGRWKDERKSWHKPQRSWGKDEDEQPKAGDRQGVLEKLVLEKGYVFIRMTDGGEASEKGTIFAHTNMSPCLKDLNQGDPVTCFVENDDKTGKLRCTGVQFDPSRSPQPTRPTPDVQKGEKSWWREDRTSWSQSSWKREEQPEGEKSWWREDRNSWSQSSWQPEKEQPEREQPEKEQPEDPPPETIPQPSRYKVIEEGQSLLSALRAESQLPTQLPTQLPKLPPALPSASSSSSAAAASSEGPIGSSRGIKSKLLQRLNTFQEALQAEAQSFQGQALGPEQVGKIERLQEKMRRAVEMLEILREEQPEELAQKMMLELDGLGAAPVSPGDIVLDPDIPLTPDIPMANDVPEAEEAPAPAVSVASEAPPRGDRGDRRGVLEEWRWDQELAKIKITDCGKVYYIPYEIDVVNKTQTNLAKGKVRNLMRVEM